MIRPAPPAYESGSLADVLPAVAVGLGIPGFAPHIELEASDRVAVLLVDGLGAQALAAHATQAPTLTSMRGQPLVTGFPSTTAVGIGSLGSGSVPGIHGLVGTLFVVPEWGGMLAPLRWGDEPNPVATSPYPTMFERIGSSGVAVNAVGPGRFAASGLTRAVLRGAEYVAAESIDDLVEQTGRLLWAPVRSLTYVYWAELDKLGHIHGVGSPEWVAGLGEVDQLVARLADVLPPGARLHVTADHGMVDCGADDVIDIDVDPVLQRDVVRIGGEPRARHLYVRPGATENVVAAWRHRLGYRAWVVDRQEAVDSGWFGVVDPDLAERIGDLVVAARGTYLLASAATDPRLSAMRGQHGSLSAEELEIPLLTAGD